ncbi:unknown protein [Seminavis robusta]|uniref:Uncharacterized protein n=1 Tax=Seminavis robusta TaxID=568900 RepID=A0A9N8HJH8_9STRA|nr:unknown protein [Seminavis robusta]|eukprot:Sro693_g188260.1 n/a (234) ;mRNA; f:19134-19835
MKLFFLSLFVAFLTSGNVATANEQLRGTAARELLSAVTAIEPIVDVIPIPSPVLPPLDAAVAAPVVVDVITAPPTSAPTGSPSEAPTVTPPCDGPADGEPFLMKTDGRWVRMKGSGSDYQVKTFNDGPSQGGKGYVFQMDPRYNPSRPQMVLNVPDRNKYAEIWTSNLVKGEGDPNQLVKFLPYDASVCNQYFKMKINGSWIRTNDNNKLRITGEEENAASFEIIPCSETSLC